MSNARKMMLWAAIGVVALAATEASAGTVYWVGNPYALEDYWFDAFTWGGQIPRTFDDVIVENGRVVALSPVTIDLTGSLGLLHAGAEFGRLTVGERCTGEVFVDDSSWLSADLVCLGDLEGASGHLTLAGGAAELQTHQFLTVGASGHGLVDMQGMDLGCGAGAVGLFHRSSGEMILQGGHFNCAGDLTVGMWGAGALQILPGARMTSAMAVIGYADEATGEVTVTSVDPRWPAWSIDDALIVGYSGNGSLAVDSESRVTAGVAVVGGTFDLMSPGSGVVRLTGGSALDVDGDLFVGESGQGELSIGNSIVQCADGYIGYGPDSDGTVSIADSGGTWSGDDLVVGCYGRGHLTIGESSGLQLTGRLTIGMMPGSEGVVSVNRRLDTNEVHVGGDLGEDGADGEPLRSDGLLDIGDSARVRIRGLLRFGRCGALRALLDSRISLVEASFANESTDPAALNDLQNAELLFWNDGESVSTLEAAAEDVGPQPDLGLHGRYAIGRLSVGQRGSDRTHVRLVNETSNTPSGVPEALYVYVLYVNSLATLDLNGINLYYIEREGSEGTIIANGGTLRQVGSPADIDGDGDVDLDDFVVIKQNFGTTDGPRWAEGDMNGDGAIDLEDFVIFKKILREEAAK